MAGSDEERADSRGRISRDSRTECDSLRDQRRRGRRALRIALAAAVLAAAVIGCLVWYGRRAGWFLPGWIVWKSGERAAEESGGDGTGGFRIMLDKREARVFSGDVCVWTSPAELRVQDALVCDIDMDGFAEMILLCWKVGRYGLSRPFWVEEDEKSWSQHLFVYDYGTDGVSPQWMSSYMGTGVAEMSLGEMSSLENEKGGGPCLLFQDPAGNMSRWYWDSWGFTRLD